MSGRARMTASGLIVVAAAVLATGTTVRAQHSGPRHAGHDTAQRCESEFEVVVRQGLGFGMAFAADKNGYPGPRHVLELKQRLRLTPDQEARTQALLEEMFAQSRPRSARLLEAERRLERLFAAGGADEAAVARTVAEVERARADVRLVHLLFHLRTRDVLTAAQREDYRRARWETPDHR
jgi:Spy/CpxP family protein refolding chaperone